VIIRVTLRKLSNKFHKFCRRGIIKLVILKMNVHCNTGEGIKPKKNSECVLNLTLRL
jgi:hypothetical protein